MDRRTFIGCVTVAGSVVGVSGCLSQPETETPTPTKPVIEWQQERVDIPDGDGYGFRVVATIEFNDAEWVEFKTQYDTITRVSRAENETKTVVLYSGDGHDYADLSVYISVYSPFNQKTAQEMYHPLGNYEQTDAPK